MKAVLKNGVIFPIDPLPPDWVEGDELDIQKTTDMVSPEAVDEWLAKMNALCADSTPEDEARLHAAIEALDRESKERARQQMGLTG